MSLAPPKQQLDRDDWIDSINLQYYDDNSDIEEEEQGKYRH